MNWADLFVITAVLVIFGGICYNLVKQRKQKASGVCPGCSHPVNTEGKAVSIKAALKEQLHR